MIAVRRRLFNGVTFAGWLFAGALSLVGAPPSAPAEEVAGFRVAMEGVRTRLLADFGAEGLARLDLAAIEAALHPRERAVLARSFLAFELVHPAIVSVLHIERNREIPFWLRDAGFEREDGRWVVGGNAYSIWSKAFPAGRVTLGTPSLGGRYDPYFVAVRPRGGGAPAGEWVRELSPDTCRVSVASVGARPYVDSGRRVEALPEAFVGAVLVATVNAEKDAGRLVELYRITDYASGPEADQVMLTWAGDPRTTQALRWRTHASVPSGEVAWAEATAVFNPASAGTRRARAVSGRLETPDVANDPAVVIHRALLEGLQAGTTYAYAVGDGSPAGWSETHTFTTAPAGSAGFSFVYLGDAQNGLDSWGRLLRAAFEHAPEAAFYLMPGDLINSGQERDDWDRFFANAAGVLDRRTLVPAIGNHEDQSGHPTLYLKNFLLPGKGPPGLERGRAYAFSYGDALFVVLDSNDAVEAQARWLDETLRETRATWKIVAYHHPAYPSRPGRSYPEVNRHWVPLFDRHGVDLALQGHDHAYLRTHPMRNGTPVEGAERGTVYMIAVSGTKMYPQGKHAYVARGLVDLPTYQVITVHADRLVGRAYDLEGRLRDEFVIDKRR